MEDQDDVVQLGVKLRSEASGRYISFCKKRTREAEAEAQGNRQLTRDAMIRLQIILEGTKRSEAITREAMAGQKHSQDLMREALAGTQRSDALTLAALAGTQRSNALTLAANAATRVSGSATVLCTFQDWEGLGLVCRLLSYCHACRSFNVWVDFVFNFQDIRDIQPSLGLGSLGGSTFAKFQL